MIKENIALLEQIVKLLEEKIEVIRQAKLDDYKEGVIDGLILAIRTIEG